MQGRAKYGLWPGFGPQTDLIWLADRQLPTYCIWQWVLAAVYCWADGQGCFCCTGRVGGTASALDAAAAAVDPDGDFRCGRQTVVSAVGVASRF